MEETTLNEKLKDLDRDVNEALRDKTKNRGVLWKNIWNEIKTISKEFKEVKFSTLNARQESWERFQETIKRVKEEQDLYFKNRSERDRVSQELLNKIINQTQRAWPHENGFMEFLAAISGATLFADLVMASIEIVIDMMTFGLLRPHEEKDARKAELNAYSAQMKKAWELYKEYKDKLIKPHRDTARQALVGTQGELQKEWDLWKLEKNKQWEARRSQFEANESSKRELISEMRSLVGSHREEGARTRVKEIFQEWRSVRSAGKDKDESLWSEFKSLHDDFYERSKESYREHIENEIEKLEEKLEKAKSNLESNREKLASARSEEFEERVRGWIEEGEAYIERLETWIDEWRDKRRKLS